MNFRQTLLIGGFLAGAAALFLGCENSNPKNTDRHIGSYQVSDVAGTWAIDLKPSIFLNIKIFIQINSDTTYGLHATADSVRLVDSITFTDTIRFVDTVFIHEGRWSFGAEDLLLAGGHCEKMVDSLHTTAPYDCGAPVSVKIDIRGNLWYVDVEDFRGIAATLGIIFDPTLSGYFQLTHQ